MAKASEIARRRPDRWSEQHWLAAILGLLATVGIGFAAVVFVRGGAGLLYHAGIALAAIVLPAAIALYAMRRSSGEFRAVWLGAVLAIVAVGAVGASVVKGRLGEALLLQDVLAAGSGSSRDVRALSEGRPAPDVSAPQAPDDRNPFVQAGYRFRLRGWQRTDDYRRYREALAATEWERMADPVALADPAERDAVEARFKRAVAAVDAWDAAERRSIADALRAVRGLSLTARATRYAEATLEGQDRDRKYWVYAEKLVLYRARDIGTTLKAYRWRREGGQVVFARRDDAETYAAAVERLARARSGRADVERMFNPVSTSPDRGQR